MPPGAMDLLVGSSPPMQELRSLIMKVAPTESTVLIQGESGTGKELVARALHELSARCQGLFIAINCGALPPGLIESELFGHVKGAFAGAIKDHPGIFEQARGGTVFLDEIGELGLELQPKLLRAVQEREVRRVGGTETIPIDVRVISATNRDLQREVIEGKFREDLYYRLAVIPVPVPPLRERRHRSRQGHDVLELAEHFLKELQAKQPKDITGFDPKAQGAMVRYSWPGHVRELENRIEQAYILGEGPLISVADMKLKLIKPKQKSIDPEVELRQLLAATTPGRDDVFNEQQFPTLIVDGGVQVSGIKLKGNFQYSKLTSFNALLRRTLVDMKRRWEQLDPEERRTRFRGLKRDAGSEQHVKTFFLLFLIYGNLENKLRRKLTNPSSMLSAFVEVIRWLSRLLLNSPNVDAADGIISRRLRRRR